MATSSHRSYVEEPVLTPYCDEDPLQSPRGAEVELDLGAFGVCGF